VRNPYPETHERRRRWPSRPIVIVVSVILLVAGAGVGGARLYQTRQEAAREAKAEAIREANRAKVLAAERALREYIDSVVADTAEIGTKWLQLRTGGFEANSDDQGVTSTAHRLKNTLLSLDPPPSARLLHHRLIEVCDQIEAFFSARARGFDAIEFLQIDPSVLSEMRLARDRLDELMIGEESVITQITELRGDEDVSLQG
jgi:hypothetical protein